MMNFQYIDGKKIIYFVMEVNILQMMPYLSQDIVSFFIVICETLPRVLPQCVIS